MGDFLAAMGPGIANHLWQSTAFVAAAWLVTLALGRNQARVRHAVWMGASVKFLVPFSLLMAAGNLLPHPKQAVAPVVYSAMDVVEEPFAGMVALPLAAPVAHAPTSRERVKAALPVTLGLLWLVGAGVVLAVFAMQGRKVRRTLRSAEMVIDGRESEILRRLETRKATTEILGLCSRMTISAHLIPTRPAQRIWRGIELRLSRARMEPGVFGVWRPVLVWPRELSARLDDAQMEAVLAHEWMHVRRRDNLTAALHMLVEAMFWFHPAVWWMERQLVKEREQACDEAVVAMGGDADAYAESLLKTCRFCVESPLACVAGVTGADLKRRVLEIAIGRALVRMSWAKKLLLAGTAVCLVGAPVMLGFSHVPLLFAQILKATGPRPSFEVASIHVFRPVVMAPPPSSPPGTFNGEPILRQREMKFSPGREGGQTSDRVHAILPVGVLIAQAYGLPPGSDGRGDGRIVGGPDWVTHDAEQYDIQAKISEQDFAAMQTMTPEQQRTQVNLMKQSLLEERFKLKVHFETRELAAYALVVAKGGPKLTPASGTQPTRLSSTQKEQTTELTATSTTMAAFAASPLLTAGTGSRTVIDETGLKGSYSFTLKWATEPAAGQEPADEPVLFTAMEEQLGLKLVPTKGPVEVIVIDQIEKPTVDGAEVTMPAQQAPKTSMDSAAPVSLQQFDAATIKHPDPNARGGRAGFYGSPGGRIFFGGPARMLVQYAYGLQAYQLTGGPAWIDAEGLGPNWFEIDAVPPADSASRNIMVGNAEPTAEQRLMLQSLLRDRFGLKSHFETKEGEVYILTRGTKPLQLKPTNYPNTDPRAVVFGTLGGIEQRPNGGGTAGGPAHSFGPISLPDGGRVALQGNNTTTDYLAIRISRYLQLPVLNQTGIEGSYDFDVPVADPESQDPAAQVLKLADDLGLKIKRGRGPVQTLVIDHIERPSEN